MKKILALLLAMLMVFALFAGCAGTDDATPTPSQSTAPETTAVPSSEPSGPVAGEVSLPLVADKAEFAIWSDAFDFNAGIKDANGSDAYQELEKRTNIHINWQHPAQGEAATQFNLVVASQDYPDCFQGSTAYFVGGLDKFIDDQVIIDITDIVKADCPNYNLVRGADDIIKGTITDTGRMPGFFGVKKTLQPSWMGPVTRADWLKDLGLDAPKTMDDYYNVLAKFRDEKACPGPLTINNNGLFQMISQAWGLGVGFYQVNGKVKFGPIEPDFKDYLILLNKWYSEKLIDPEFYTVAFGTRAYDTTYTLTGKVGIWPVAYNFMQTNLMLAASDQPTYDLVAIQCPTLNAGDTREIGLEFYIQTDRFQNNIAAVTTQCQDPILLAKWFDYLYTEEGGILGSYGIENKSLQFDDNGKPKVTELIYNNPDGLAAFNAMCRYAMSPNQAMLYDWERELLPNMYQQALDAPGIWDSNYNDTRTLPTMKSISSEESAEYAGIINDINTLINETVVKFVIGDKSLDEYESLVEQIKSMNIDRAIEIQQAALDRYNAR